MEPSSVHDIEKLASKAFDRNVSCYYNSGADDEETLRDNVNAFRRIRIRPRVLIDVSNINLSTSILGHQIAMPIGIAPSAAQKLAHPDGEIATAKVAKSMKTCMTLSTHSTTTMEDVAAACGDALRWFQLYVGSDLEQTRQFIRRAERCGYTAIVVTVDVPTAGNRISELRHRFHVPPHLHFANFSSQLSKTMNDDELKKDLWTQISCSITWKSIRWMQTVTSLPIIVKGVLTAEDAIEAVRAGVKGIWVSNHGGRQLDTTATAIEALPEIVKVVQGKVEIYADGGIRRGTDVFKALALGAQAVFVGRPVLWGLRYNGLDGVKTVLQMLQDEFRRTMQLAGCVSVKDITSSSIISSSNFSKI